MNLKTSWPAAILGALALSAGAPASASLLFNGVTYTLLESPLSSTSAQFTLDITGINGTADVNGPDGGGRFGVNSFAFTEQPPGSVTGGSFTSGSINGSGSTGPFTFMTGGLNAMGCDGSGNDFCFKANTAPTAPALPANSTLALTFDVTFGNATELADFDPSFKVQWLGTNSKNGKSGYNLVSTTLTPTVVPLPAALPLLFSGLAGLGLMRRRKAL